MKKSTVAAVAIGFTAIFVVSFIYGYRTQEKYHERNRNDAS